MIKNGIPKKPYSRILIRRRKRAGDVVETCHGAYLQGKQPKSYESPEMPLPMAAEDPKAYNQNQ